MQDVQHRVKVAEEVVTPGVTLPVVEKDTLHLASHSVKLRFNERFIQGHRLAILP